MRAKLRWWCARGITFAQTGEQDEPRFPLQTRATRVWNEVRPFPRVRKCLPRYRWCLAWRWSKRCSHAYIAPPVWCVLLQLTVTETVHASPPVASATSGALSTTTKYSFPPLYSRRKSRLALRMGQSSQRTILYLWSQQKAYFLYPRRCQTRPLLSVQPSAARVSVRC